MAIPYSFEKIMSAYKVLRDNTNEDNYSFVSISRIAIAAGVSAAMGKKIANTLEELGCVKIYTRQVEGKGSLSTLIKVLDHEPDEAKYYNLLGRRAANQGHRS